MLNSKLIILINVALGLVPIILGIIGIVTPNWINVQVEGDGSSTIYGLFRRCGTDDSTSVTCQTLSSFKMIQGLQIAGVCILAIGVIVAIILKLFLSSNDLYLISSLLPMIGSILILVGSLLYAKYVIENYSNSFIKVTIGYSMLLIVISCICGFLATVHYSFNAGYIYSRNRSTISPS